MTKARPSLVLITPARNEAANLPRLFDAMLKQTAQPVRWLIVNDGSTDDTESVVRQYSDGHDWIRLLNLPTVRSRSFAAKATCFMAGYRDIGISADIVGNLDADVSFDPDYLAFLLDQFAEDPTLGVAGTPFTEPGYDSTRDSFEGEAHVAGGCQLFRRGCFEAIGGYQPAPIGVDWVAVTTARLKGWRTGSFREKSFQHHRALGTAGRSRFRAWFFYGEKDYLLGWHPLYELARLGFQTLRNPAKGCCIAAGYVSASVRRPGRALSDELMRFHRKEQLAKLRLVTSRFVRLRPVDSFSAASD